MTDLTSQDASVLAQQISDGRLTATALMAATLRKIEAVNPQLNAVVSLRSADVLMDEARAADAQTDQTRAASARINLNRA
ncbi:MAG: hypothetical protein JKX69_09745, partial [Rhodobacteraceae bacterium]|nr:hypothetical protein [Paracoccaceae bacterium]